MPRKLLAILTLLAAALLAVAGLSAAGPKSI